MQGQQSCFDRVKMGFMMGMCVGMASGALFGGFGALRMGLRGRELIGQVGQAFFVRKYLNYRLAGRSHPIYIYRLFPNKKVLVTYQFTVCFSER